MKRPCSLLLSLSLSCILFFYGCNDDESKIPKLKINFSLGDVKATSLEIFAGTEGEMAKEMYVVHGTTPGLNENSPNKITVTQPDFFIEELVPATTYFVKCYALSQGGELKSTPEISFTTEALSISAPEYARKGENISIMGNYFSMIASENEVKFGSTVAQVISSDGYTLVVKVPDSLDDEPVHISVKANGAVVTLAEEFIVNNLYIDAVTPASAGPGNVVRIDGRGFNENVQVELNDGNGNFIPQQTDFHIDQDGNYLTFLVDPNLAPGDYDLYLALSPILLPAADKFTVTASSWVAKANFPGTPRENAVSFTINNSGYYGLGTSPAGMLNDFWVYDFALDRWTQAPDFPGTARENAFSFSVNDVGYVGGGDGDGFELFQDLWSFDPVNNRWTAETDYPFTARASSTAVTIGDKAYVGLGRDVDGLKNDWWEFTPAQHAWAHKADLPASAREYAIGFSLNNLGYVGFGNGNGLTVKNDFWKYDPLNNSWSQVSDAGPVALSDACAFVIGNKGYMVTGFNNLIEGTTRCWIYDPENNTWIEEDPFTGTGRWSANSFSNGEKAFIIGGSDGANLYADMFEFQVQ